MVWPGHVTMPPDLFFLNLKNFSTSFTLFESCFDGTTMHKWFSLRWFGTNRCEVFIIGILRSVSSRSSEITRYFIYDHIYIRRDLILQKSIPRLPTLCRRLSLGLFPTEWNQLFWSTVIANTSWCGGAVSAHLRTLWRLLYATYRSVQFRGLGKGNFFPVKSHWNQYITDRTSTVPSSYVPPPQLRIMRAGCSRDRYSPVAEFFFIYSFPGRKPSRRNSFNIRVPSSFPSSPSLPVPLCPACCRTPWKSSFDAIQPAPLGTRREQSCTDPCSSQVPGFSTTLVHPWKHGLYRWRRGPLIQEQVRISAICGRLLSFSTHSWCYSSSTPTSLAIRFSAST